MTISSKILASSSGKEEVHPGDIVKAKVDVAMMPDLTSILAIKAMRSMGFQKVWDNKRVVIILDHNAPASSLLSAALHRDIRKFVKEQQLKYFYDVEAGVCHQVLPEKGHVKPGTIVVGADSHTCTHGAFNAFATGMGSTDLGAILATGRTWLKVPETIKVTVLGLLPEMITPKDVILRIIKEIGADGATYKTVEFGGETVSNMSISGRMTLCNMAVEMGGKTGLVHFDEKTSEYLKERTDGVFKPFSADPDAEYETEIKLDVSDLEPQIACPPNVDDVKPLSEVSGKKIDQVFVGSCTNGRYEDLEITNSILKNKKVHGDVRLLIVPASMDVYKKALQKGIILDLARSGAIVSNPSCGACFGGHIGLLAPGEIGLTTSNRNFKGRQGSPEAKVYLASPAVAGASALTGVITDPRDVT
jgi:3-isopropylmalate/(R)-2-methylmalate dehydratase large subunit